MDSRTRRGYVRLLRDLQQLGSSDPFRNSIERAKASIDEFERLIARLEKLGNDPEGLSSSPSDKQRKKTR